MGGKSGKAMQGTVPLGGTEFLDKSTIKEEGQSHGMYGLFCCLDVMHPLVQSSGGLVQHPEETYNLFCCSYLQATPCAISTGLSRR
jgi:hypothetical protein